MVIVGPRQFATKIQREKVQSEIISRLEDMETKDLLTEWITSHCYSADSQENRDADLRDLVADLLLDAEIMPRLIGSKLGEFATEILSPKNAALLESIPPEVQQFLLHICRDEHAEKVFELLIMANKSLGLGYDDEGKNRFDRLALHLSLMDLPNPETGFLKYFEAEAAHLLPAAVGAAKRLLDLDEESAQTREAKELFLDFRESFPIGDDETAHDRSKRALRFLLSQPELEVLPPGASCWMQSSIDWLTPELVEHLRLIDLHAPTSIWRTLPEDALHDLIVDIKKVREGIHQLEGIGRDANGESRFESLCNFLKESSMDAAGFIEYLQEEFPSSSQSFRSCLIYEVFDQRDAQISAHSDPAVEDTYDEGGQDLKTSCIEELQKFDATLEKFQDEFKALKKSGDQDSKGEQIERINKRLLELRKLHGSLTELVEDSFSDM